MTPRLVATDLDGTLVRRDGTVSPYTREVLAALEARGVPVIFVTGRPLRWAELVFEHVGSHGLAIVSNGALVWDVAAQTPRLERTIAPDLALEVATRLRTALPGTHFGIEALGRFAIEAGYADQAPHVIEQGVRRAPLEELVDAPLLKLLARHDRHEPDDYWRLAEEAVGELVTVTHSSTTALLEISGAGVTKATTLERVAADLGVAGGEVIAFGDMPNDIAMLSWAGTSYAMADAHPRAVAAAGHLAPSHEDDGVARVLAEVFDM